LIKRSFQGPRLPDIAILRTPDPDLAAVQAAELLARSAHIVERHVARVRNESR
jgi:hypothetical protein